MLHFVGKRRGTERRISMRGCVCVLSEVQGGISFVKCFPGRAI
jgi:hypothetical protein